MASQLSSRARAPRGRSARSFARTPEGALRRRARAKTRRQEGGVILIVLLVVSMMSGLAAYAAQNGTFEARSVGGTRQIKRLRRSGESFLVAVGSYIGDRFMGGKGTVTVADTRWTVNAVNPTDNFRRQFNLPAYVDDPSLMQV